MADDGSWADENQQEENLVSFSGLKSRTFLYRVKRILGFHSRDTGHGNGCYPPSLCPSSVNNLEAKRRECDSSRWSTVL